MMIGEIKEGTEEMDTITTLQKTPPNKPYRKIGYLRNPLFLKSSKTWEE